jgi:hypothetical protein
MDLEAGVKFDVLYRDHDLVKVCVSAWNGTFGGTADVYLGANQLGEVARQLRGFPKNVSDNREVMLGTFGPESAGGGVSMRFFCIDRSGHAYVETKIESDRDAAGRVQSALLFVPIEAGALDAFVDELHTLDTEKTATAYLRATVPV